jgi:integration host factor subunit beta
MTKADLIDDLCRAMEISRKESEEIIDTILGGIAGALHRGDRIEIRGLGSFGTRLRRARVGRNPKTGARVDVAAKRVPYFRPSRELKNLVNAGSMPETP